MGWRAGQESLRLLVAGEFVLLTSPFKNAVTGNLGSGTASFIFSQSALRLCTYLCQGEGVFQPGTTLGPLADTPHVEQPKRVIVRVRWTVSDTAQD